MSSRLLHERATMNATACRSVDLLVYAAVRAIGTWEFDQ